LGCPLSFLRLHGRTSPVPASCQFPRTGGQPGPSSVPVQSFPPLRLVSTWSCLYLSRPLAVLFFVLMSSPFRQDFPDPDFSPPPPVVLVDSARPRSCSPISPARPMGPSLKNHFSTTPLRTFRLFPSSLDLIYTPFHPHSSFLCPVRSFFPDLCFFV